HLADQFARLVLQWVGKPISAGEFDRGQFLAELVRGILNANAQLVNSSTQAARQAVSESKSCQRADGPDGHESPPHPCQSVAVDQLRFCSLRGVEIARAPAGRQCVGLEESGQRLARLPAARRFLPALTIAAEALNKLLRQVALLWLVSQRFD